MTLEDWLANACADADRRGLPDLKRMLPALADATRALRAAAWDSGAGPVRSAPPAAPPPVTEGGNR
jgi:hypothetical protein